MRQIYYYRLGSIAARLGCYAVRAGLKLRAAVALPPIFTPKVEFYKTIKELETRLAPTADGKTVVLNSFIMSGTPASQLRQWWLMER